MDRDWFRGVSRTHCRPSVAGPSARTTHETRPQHRAGGGFRVFPSRERGSGLVFSGRLTPASHPRRPAASAPAGTAGSSTRTPPRTTPSHARCPRAAPPSSPARPRPSTPKPPTHAPASRRSHPGPGGMRCARHRPTPLRPGSPPPAPTRTASTPTSHAAQQDPRTGTPGRPDAAPPACHRTPGTPPQEAPTSPRRLAAAPTDPCQRAYERPRADGQMERALLTRRLLYLPNRTHLSNDLRTGRTDSPHRRPHGSSTLPGNHQSDGRKRQQPRKERDAKRSVSERPRLSLSGRVPILDLGGLSILCHPKNSVTSPRERSLKRLEHVRTWQRPRPRTDAQSRRREERSLDSAI